MLRGAAGRRRRRRVRVRRGRGRCDRGRRGRHVDVCSRDCDAGREGRVRRSAQGRRGVAWSSCRSSCRCEMAWVACPDRARQRRRGRVRCFASSKSVRREDRIGRRRGRVRGGRRGGGGKEGRQRGRHALSPDGTGGAVRMYSMGVELSSRCRSQRERPGDGSGGQSRRRARRVVEEERGVGNGADAPARAREPVRACLCTPRTLPVPPRVAGRRGRAARSASSLAGGGLKGGGGVRLRSTRGWRGTESPGGGSRSTSSWRGGG